MKNKGVAAAVAIVLILICFIPVILFFSRKKGADYEIVCFGDSVMACTYGEGAVPYYIGELTGRPTLNAAFGGLSMSKTSENTKAGDTSSFFTMASLSGALLNKDFSLQVTATKPGIGVYPKKWYEVALELDKLDYSKVKYVIIEHGVNDYLSGIPVDDASDRYNVHTFAGALRTSIENVQKAIPGATIVLVTPTYTHISFYDKDCYEADFGGGILPDYVAKEKEVAAEYGLTFVDNLNGSGINKDNYKKYLYDGLHAHQDGNLLIAENIVRNVEGIIKDEITP
ncbi:MAG: SGNH/GDSL hydrolase family protein [Lachnospiraceae bacterium]|nr:SGNH/GDSL hydrolase family protein [Lachnospiraceae bacterium]